MKECKRLVGLEVEEAKRDTPRAYLIDLLHKTAFKGSPLGRCPLLTAGKPFFIGFTVAFREQSSGI